MTTYTFEPIGYVRSCFKEKFGIPRQPGLVPEAKAVIEISPPFARAEAFRHLEHFSHIWIIFVFHQCLQSQWRATVRPPRLGGNRRVGVFASRSGFRPNPIGQSAVALETIESEKGVIRLNVAGADLLDGTPVLDIKPYLPYSDSLSDASGGYAPGAPEPARPVVFSAAARHRCDELEKGPHPRLGPLITALLAQDPRPGYASGPSQRQYGMLLWDLNIKFRVEETRVVVNAIEPAE